MRGVLLPTAVPSSRTLGVPLVHRLRPLRLGDRGSPRVAEGPLARSTHRRPRRLVPHPRRSPRPQGQARPGLSSRPALGEHPHRGTEPPFPVPLHRLRRRTERLRTVLRRSRAPLAGAPARSPRSDGWPPVFEPRTPTSGNISPPRWSESSRSGDLSRKAVSPPSALAACSRRTRPDHRGRGGHAGEAESLELRADGSRRLGHDRKACRRGDRAKPLGGWVE